MITQGISQERLQAQKNTLVYFTTLVCLTKLGLFVKNSIQYVVVDKAIQTTMNIFSLLFLHYFACYYHLR